MQSNEWEGISLRVESARLPATAPKLPKMVREAVGNRWCSSDVLHMLTQSAILRAELFD